MRFREPSRSATAHASPSVSSAALAEWRKSTRFFALEVNAIDKRVGPLGVLDRLRQGCLAAAVIAVGEKDQSLSALLLLHQLVRGKIYSIVKQGTGATTAPMMATAATSRPASAGLLVTLRGCDLRYGRFEFLAGLRDVLKQLNLTIKMDHKGRIHLLTQYLFKKAFTRRAFLIQHRQYAAARVHQ